MSTSGGVGGRAPQGALLPDLAQYFGLEKVADSNAGSNSAIEAHRDQHAQANNACGPSVGCGDQKRLGGRGRGWRTVTDRFGSGVQFSGAVARWLFAGVPKCIRIFGGASRFRGSRGILT